MRILIVEDSDINLALFHAVLRRGGHEIVAARDVGEGRQLLRGPPPDVVLLDIHLPGGGGEVLLREIRAEPKLMHLPVVAVTASAMQGDRERLLDAGFDEYVSKPIDTRTFAATIASVATGRQRGSASAP